MAGNLNFKQVKFCLTDSIFQKCGVDEIKSAGLAVLTTLQIILYNEPLLVTDKQQKQQLISNFHDNPMYGGHCGQKRLLSKLKGQFKWKGMSKDVAKYVKNCEKCQMNKVKAKQREEMVITPTPQKPFDITCIDTIGPFLKTDNNNVYALTLQCELTKYVVIIPVPNKEANTIAKALVERFILIYGPMKQIRTDMGTEYKNEVLSNVTKILGIDHKTSTAYHSQSIGSCERNHRVLNEYLRSYANETKTDWDTWVPYYSFCYNTTPSTYHQYTPFELLFGRKVNIPESLITEINPVYNIEAYEKELRFRLQLAHNKTREYLEKIKAKRKIEYDKRKNPINVGNGDRVLVTNENRTKLDPWYKGPFKVISCDSPNCTIENEKGKQFKVHKNRLQIYNSN